MNTCRTIFRIGDISTSRFWLSVERKPVSLARWHLSFGRTYNGTLGGMCLCTPWFVVISHLRGASR